MKQAVILLCGVPGSGKTWVMKQLPARYQLVHHDDYIGHAQAHLAAAVNEAAKGPKPVVADCPFAERAFREALEAHGLEVYPFFVVEPPDVVAQRYMAREGKPAAKATLTRAVTIADRAREWAAPMGSADETLRHLLELVISPAPRSSPAAP